MPDYLNDEEGAERVEKRLIEATRDEVVLLMTAVNVCEVYYDCLRAKGVEKGGCWKKWRVCRLRL